MAATGPGRLEAWLASRRLPLAALGLAALLSLPALRGGFFGDDWILLAKLRRSPPTLAAAAQLYQLTPGDALLADCLQRGPCPWYTDPALRLSLLRPLSSLLFAADARLFGEGPAGAALAHLHSILWYLAAVAAAGLVLRRALPGAAGGLALLLFAADEAHWMPVGWLANRHALAACALGFGAVAAHLRWREEGWRPGAWLSPLCGAAALCAGESALQALAFLFAWEAFGAPAGRRLRGLWPQALLVAAWLSLYRALGFGARSHDQYLDPLGAPAQALAALARRLPALLGDLLGGMPSDLWGAIPRWSGPLQALLVAVGLAVCAVVALLLRAAWPAVPEGERRALRWLVPGALLALLPGALGPAGSRVLLAPGLGGFALAAVVLWRGRERLRAWPAGAPGRASLRLGLAWQTAIHAVVPPLVLPGLLLLLGDLGRRTERMVREAELSPPPGAAAPAGGPDVLVLAVPDLQAMLYPAVLGQLGVGPPHRGWWTLSLAPADHRLVRTGERSFTLESVGTPMLRSEHERFFRSRRRPLRPGERVAIGGLAVEVLTESAIAVTTAVPLEDPALAVVTVRGGRLVRVPLPPPGGELLLPGEPGPLGL